MYQMQLISFFFFTVLAWLAAQCILRTFFLMIAPDGALDKVFNWQSMLSKMYQSPNKWVNLLGKAMGDCRQCTAFWFMPVWFLFYYAFCRLVLHFYITDEVTNIFGRIFVGVVWYAIYHSIGSVWAVIVLSKASKNK